MKIGILQTGRSPDELRAEFGDYDGLFRRLLAGRGFEFETWPVLDGVFPPGPEAADGWLITGSRFGVYEDHPWIAPLEDLIRAIHAAGGPLVGICFGHQIVAQALGGRVAKYDGGWAVGAQAYETPGGRDCLLAWHQDQVIEKPAAAEVVGTSDFCRYAALRYDDRALTFQAHPEFTPAFLRALIGARRQVLPPALADTALAGLDGCALSTAPYADLIAGFLKRDA